MAEPLSTNDLLREIQSIVETQSGEHDLVDIQAGGVSPWVAAQAPCFHWWLDIARLEQKLTTIPGSQNRLTARREWTVVLEGWYPASVQLNSATTWRDKLDAVVMALEKKKVVARAAIQEQMPQVVKDGFARKTSLSQGDQSCICHFGRVRLRFAQEFEYTVEV